MLRDNHLSTLSVHAGGAAPSAAVVGALRRRGAASMTRFAGEDCNPTTAIATPVFQSATFTFDSAEAIGEAMQEPFHDHFYGRYATPNTASAAAAIAALEGAEHGLVTSSGMAACSLVLLTFLKSGDHMIAQKTHYPTVSKFISQMLPQYGVEVTIVDQTAPVEFENAIKANTKLIYVETPCNPTLALTDLKSIAFIGKKHGLLTVVDNTFASPFNQRPLEFGIDIVVHSATKYLAGHSDVVAGAVCGSRAHVERLWPTHVMLGGCLHPNEAWLLCRGIKTFALRMRQINTNGLAVARWLQDQPAVERVHYPWLLSHPQHDLAVAQMKGGSGMIVFELFGGRDAGFELLKRVKLLKQAVSLGGVHSLMVHPASTVSAVQSAKDTKNAGVTPGMVRLSVGIEDVDDIINDLKQALAAATPPSQQQQQQQQQQPSPATPLSTSAKRSSVQQVLRLLAPSTSGHHVTEK